jgi:uncharacterized peroxidase-related enzyme
MTWIRTIPKSQADDAYRAALEAQHAWYPQEYAEQVPGVPTNDGDGIVAALSLIPNALHHHFATFGTLMDPALPLNRRQHELIATVVSQANCTRYCSVSHREFLRRATGDAALVDAVQQDFRTAPLSDADRAMCDYADQLTRDATKLQKSDIDHLRSVGFDDRGILQITLIAAWFNSINRVADALGVGRDE